MSKKDLDQKVGLFISPIKTTVLITQTVDEALFHLRKSRIAEKIFYFYVIDEYGHLKGVLSTRNLLLSSPNQKISELIDGDILSISADHTLRQAMEKLTGNRLLALPVVDEDNRLLGIIDIQLYFDEAVDVAKVRPTATDLFQVLGLKLEEGKAQSLWNNYKTRMPWLVCNMVGGLTCAIISRVFELVLLEVILLAMFIPLVLTLSESISMQSMTYSLQLTQRPKISGRRILYRILSEWKMVFLIAITCGVVVGGLSIFWGQGIKPAYAICAGIILSMNVSGMVGAAIPLVLHARKLDPKVAAGPVVLMVVDVITTATYLGLSTWWLL